MQFGWNSETEMSNHHGSLKSRTPGRDSTTQHKSISYFFFPFIRFLLPEKKIKRSHDETECHFLSSKLSATDSFTKVYKDLVQRQLDLRGWANFAKSAKLCEISQDFKHQNSDSQMGSWQMIRSFLLNWVMKQCLGIRFSKGHWQESHATCILIPLIIPLGMTRWFLLLSACWTVSLTASR